jgi:hypothetical protein
MREGERDEGRGTGWWVAATGQDAPRAGDGDGVDGEGEVVRWNCESGVIKLDKGVSKKGTLPLSRIWSKGGTLLCSRCETMGGGGKVRHRSVEAGRGGNWQGSG